VGDQVDLHVTVLISLFRFPASFGRSARNASVHS
jgi:hypothetical protein